MLTVWENNMFNSDGMLRCPYTLAQIKYKVRNILTPAPGSQSVPLDVPLIKLTG